MPGTKNPFWSKKAGLKQWSSEQAQRPEEKPQTAAPISADTLEQVPKVLVVHLVMELNFRRFYHRTE